MRRILVLFTIFLSLLIFNISKKVPFSPSFSNSTENLFHQVINNSTFGINLNYGDISISEIDFQGLTSHYLVNIKTGANWSNNLWVVDFNECHINNIKTINAVEGMVEKSSFISISQGDFIEVYESSHMDNGNVKLISLNDTSKSKYEFKNIIDKHYEEFEIEDINTNYKLSRGILYSFVYAGGYLTSQYTDVNSDGYTDAVFSGIQELFAENNDEPVYSYFIKKVYLYNPSNNEFIYNKSKRVYNDLSQKNDSLYK